MVSRFLATVTEVSGRRRECRARMHDEILGPDLMRCRGRSGVERNELTWLAS